METYPVFIGYDKREDEACRVTRNSLLKLSTVPLHVQWLDQKALRDGGLYTREEIEINGKTCDAFDRKPFSTEFTFTRFAVPALCQYQGWALFVDGDFMFRADVGELFGLIDDKYAVMVVQHDYQPTETVKMDGQPQKLYYRKNWSSLILWNCAHPSNRCVSLDWVNRMAGLYLHAFNWLEPDEIGALPETWNSLVGHSNTVNPKAVHFTDGAPCLEGYENVAYSDEFRAYA
ncbi:MAG: hypothetical protein J3T61_00290 [Candidatus Brocadiales bacterium]|nr:hypothetical protein [Candidatus Bathyanammoxibius sp.]